MAHDTWTLTGTLTKLDGITPCIGHILATPNVSAINDTVGNIVMVGQQRVELDPSGHFSLDLLCNSANFIPASGLAYTIRFVLAGVAVHDLTVAAQSVSVMVDIADISGDTPPGGGTGGTAGVTSVNARTGVVTLTKTDVGLSNVDNTSDATKPLSSASTAALATKASTTHHATHGAAGSDPVTLTAAQLSDLTETVQDIVGALIVAGSNVTVSYDDTAGTFTVNASTGGTTDPEVVRDTIGSALVASAGIQITVNDAGDTITIASTAVLPTRQVIAGTGLTGGGDLSADRTLAVAYGTTSTTAAAGDDARITGAAQKSANLSDLASSATARSNLGLGTAATHAATDFDTAGAAAAAQSAAAGDATTKADAALAAALSGDVPLPGHTGAPKEYVLGLDPSTGVPVWRYPLQLVSHPGDGQQPFITDIAAYNGTGNGVGWSTGTADGADDQGFFVDTGSTGQHSLKFFGDGVLKVDNVPVTPLPDHTGHPPEHVLGIDHGTGLPVWRYPNVVVGDPASDWWAGLSDEPALNPSGGSGNGVWWHAGTGDNTAGQGMQVVTGDGSAVHTLKFFANGAFKVDDVAVVPGPAPVGYVAVVDPATDTRPTHGLVIWVGGATQPTNMVTGDLWVKDA